MFLPRMTRVLRVPPRGSRALQQALDRELLLLERHGLPFTTLVVSTRLGRSMRAKLRRSLRASDTLGILPDGHLGILLANTPPAEGGALAADLHRRVGHPTPLDYRVYAAPHDLGAGVLNPIELLRAPVGPARRLVDIIAASAALILLSPILLGLTILIRLDSPGPVLFAQERAGLGGRTFRFLKFRSMVQNAEQQRDALAGRNEHSGPIFKVRRDPRITGVGRWMRRYSLDELPQLWNVITGDMSLLGPRPPLPAEVQRYEPWQLRRLTVPGGLTCTWQVSGRSDISFQQWMRMDCAYIRNRSLATDTGLLLKTIPAVLTGRGAC